MNSERWKQIKGLFDEVVELTPDKRSQLLDQACGNDQELRREVESLLVSYREADSFMEKPSVAEVATLIIDPKRIESGKSFGHYQIIRQIGVGGMGEVYLARDTKLDRQVAIKFLNPQFSLHDSNLNRFIKEAKAASALNHPNILVIHEISESEDIKFIVSEFIEGETLREVINKSSLKPADIIEIAIQIANALVAAHQARIIHRDIKPENIIVRPDGYVKILDFGLAKLVERKTEGFESSAVTQNQTAKGIILGTVNYMSPEQAKGEEVDEQTDIFSFGTVLYEMLAGTIPFAGDSMSETFANLINSDPKPLSYFVSNLPDDLQAIVSKSLQKKKKARYRTMRDLLTDLKILQKRLDFETELGRENSTPKTDKKTSGMVKLPVPIEEQNNSIAVLPFTNMTADAENEYFCEGLAEELLNALAKIDDLRVAARTSAFSFKGKNKKANEIGNSLNVNKILQGSVRKLGDQLRITVQLFNASDGYQIWSNQYDGRMKDIFDLQDKITLAVIDELKIKFLSKERAIILKRYTDDPQAYEFYLKGIYYRWKLTPEEFGKSRGYFQKAIDADPDFALAHFGLASYYGYGTAWGLLPIPPDQGWKLAEAAMEKVLESDPDLPDVHIRNAMNLVHHREWEESGQRIERAAELNPKFPGIHHLYGLYLLAVGRFDEAIEEARRALELDPLSLSYSRFFGICFYFARRYDEAVKQLNQTLELEPNAPSVHRILGDVFSQMGMHTEAVSAWKREMILEGDDELVNTLSRSKDNFTETVRSIAIKRIERMQKKIAAGEFVLAIEFARNYLLLGDREKTFHWLEKAVAERNVFPLLIKSDPFYDPVRADKRFQDLIRQIGFPPDQTIDRQRSVAANTEDRSSDETPIKDPITAGNSPNQRYFIISALMILVISVIGLGYYFLFQNRTSTEGKRSLAVLPFVNGGQDINAEYLSDGITESVINNLSQISGLRVMSRNSVFRFKDSQNDTKNIAGQLGVETLVTGSVSQLGDKLIINVRLINGNDDTQIWGHQYVRNSGDIITAQNEIAQAVAQNLRVKLTNSDEQKLRKKYTENVDAYQLYLRGRFHVFKLNPEEVQKGIAYFQQAIAIDPNYAIAYAGIADAYRSLAVAGEMEPTEFLSKSKAAAEKAIEIDDTLSAGHTALGMTVFWGEWDWTESEAQYKRAIELDPNDVSAHLFYAHLLSNTGRHAEALSEARISRELDPLWPFAGALEGQFLLHAGRPDEALERLRKTFELEPNFWMPHLFAAAVYIEKGMYEKAIDEARRSKSSSNQTLSIALEGYALAKLGKSNEARSSLEELLNLSTTPRFVPPCHIALIYNGLGDTDKTLEWLIKGYDLRDPKMAFLKVDPKWRNLYSDARFVDLLGKLGFTQ